MRLIPIASLNKWPLSSMEDVFKTFNLSDNNEILRGYAKNDRTVLCTEFHNYAVFHPKDTKV